MRTSLRLLTPAIAPLVLLADTTVLAAQDTASGRGIGVVTALQGQATVSRATLPQPAPLRFKENVFFRDRITTKERSTLRLLLGGKGVLTIREQSQVTLDEQVAGPAPQSVISLAAGKVGAAIARSLMRPGETVEIRTPNASAAVRGTVLIAEYLPPTQNAAAPERLLLASAGGAWPILAQAGGAGQSNFFVLSGQVTVSVAGQPPVTLGAMQSVSVTATPAGVAVGGVQAMTPEQAAQASQGLQAGKAPAGAAEAGRGAQAQAQIAAALATAIVEASQAGQPTAPPGGASADSAPSQGGDSTTEQATETPITPDVSTATTENTPPAGSLVEISETAVGLAAGVPLADIADGAVNSVAAMAISGTGTLARTTPLLSLRGKTITHSGRLAGLAAGAALAGAAADFETALLRVDGNSLTNTDAELLRLRGGSSVTTYGPLLGLKTGATATLAGLLDASENSWVELRLAEGVRVPTGTTLKADQPLFRLTEGDALHDADGNLLPVLKTAGALLGVSGGKVELSGPGQVLQAVDSKVHLGGSLLRIAGTGATLTGTATAPMVFVENHPLTVAGSLLDLREGATVTTSGIVLDAKESDVIVTGPLFAIRGASRLELSGGPLVRLRGGSLTGTGGFGDSDEVGNHITATGAMLDATDATITFSRTTATDIPAAGASTEVLAFDMPAGASQVTLTNTDYTDTTEDEVGMLPSGTATFHGRLLLATDSRLDLGGKLFQVDGATDKVTTTETEPLIRLRGTEVTTGRPAVRVSKGELTTSGPLLRAEVSDAGTASTITSVSGHSILAVEAGGKLSGTAGTSLLQLTNTTVEPGAYVADVQGAGSTLGLAGPLAALEAGGSVTAENGFLRLWNGGSLSGTGTTPLVTSSAADFTGGDGANTGGSFLWMGSGPGQTETKLDLRGGLLSDTASTLETTDGDFLAVRDGATLTTASTGAALVTLNGSTVKAPKTLFRFGPESSSAAAAGSGEITTVSLSGPLVDATNTAFSTTGGGFLGVLDKTSFTGTGTEPLISLKKAGTSWSTVDTPAGHVLFLEAPSGTTPPTLTLNGPLLKAVGAVITSGDTTGTPPANANSVLRVTGSAELTGKGSGALVQLSEGASVTAAGDFLTIRSSQTGTNSLVDLTGPLAGLDDATFTSTATGPACCSFLMLAESGKLTGRGSEALITLASSSEVTTNGPFLKLAGSSRLGLAGPLLSATASDVTADGDAFMDVSNSEITATGGTEPFISLSGGGLTLASPVAMFRVRDGGTVSVPGSLFKASNTTFTFTTLAPVLSLVDGSLTEGSRLLDLQTSTLDLGTQPLVKMASGSTLTTIGAGPIIHVTGGSLAAAALISTDGAANTLKLA
ncbi:MAG: FecR domain-containing protein, partial [Candidatus Methylomirabilales bacterium]